MGRPNKEDLEMQAVVDWLFGAASEMPREPALAGRPDIIALQIGAQLLIALSLFAIAFSVVWFVRCRRADLIVQQRTLARLFAGFAVLCGGTFVTEVATLWYPVYGLQGLVVAGAAVLSIATVGSLWPQLPALLRPSSSELLAEANRTLRREVAAHESTLREFETAHRELESRVIERTDELTLVKARLETALRGSNVTVFTQDRDLRYALISKAMLGRAPEDIVGRTDEELIPADVRAPIVAMKRTVLESGIPRDGEICLPEEGLRWYDLHIEPMRDSAGAVVGITCAAVDITERKESEAHLRLVMRELTHRSKNLLAVIQAMARQTARDTGNIGPFLDQFGARLQALAHSHDLLVREGWHGVLLEELVRLQVDRFLTREPPPIVLRGPSVWLRPEAAQNLGLALHELAENAARYGALSVPAGRLSIEWTHRSAEEGAGLDIRWVERDGPAVAEPIRRGFGSVLIERNLRRSLDAEVELTFAPDGLRCRISLPLTQLYGV
jgi:PAS domain S-box-containing protein